MKLATLTNGARDGVLAIVNRDLTRMRAVPHIAATLQQALDDWARAAPLLQAEYESLNAGDGASLPFDPARCAAPPAARLPMAGRIGLPEPRGADAPRPRRRDAAFVPDRSADVPGRVG